MTAAIVTQTIIYALSSDPSKVLLVAEKITRKIRELNNRPVAAHYTEVVKEFLRKNNIFMKYITVYKHIKESREYNSKNSKDYKSVIDLKNPKEECDNNTDSSNLEDGRKNDINLKNLKENHNNEANSKDLKENNKNETDYNRKNEAVEECWNYLYETMEKMYRELEKLEQLLISHEARWFFSWWEPSYKPYLDRINDIDKEFETRFSWYERIVNISIKV